VTGSSNQWDLLATLGTNSYWLCRFPSFIRLTHGCKRFHTRDKHQTQVFGCQPGLLVQYFASGMVARVRGLTDSMAGSRNPAQVWRVRQFLSPSLKQRLSHRALRARLVVPRTGAEYTSTPLVSKLSSLTSQPLAYTCAHQSQWWLSPTAVCQPSSISIGR
jgi:hypothetical protein